MKIKEIFGVDLRSLALFRMALALLLIVELTDRATGLRTFYTDEGVLPRVAAIQFMSSWDVSLHMVSGALAMQAILISIQILFAVLLFVGYRTRFATLMSWLLFNSLNNRNLIVIGGTGLVGLLLFWGIFVPLGARYSFDRTLGPPSQRSPDRVFSMGTAALLLQFAFVFWFAAWAKLGSEEWRSGSALYYALGLEQYTKPLGLIMRHLPAPFLIFLSRSALLFEFVGPLLLFAPFFTPFFRLFTITAFFVFLLSIRLLMEINLFTWTCTVALLPFIPGEFWNRLFTKYKSLKSYLKPGSLTLRSSFLSNTFAALCLVYVFFSNIEGVTEKTFIPVSLRWVGDLLNLDQVWNMYVAVKIPSFWFVIPGRLKDGSEVDLLQEGRPLTWEKPKFFSSVFKSQPWSYSLLAMQSYKETFGPYFSWYFCREWNSHHQGGKQLEELQVAGMYQDILPHLQYGPPEQVLLFNYKCF